MILAGYALNFFRETLLVLLSNVFSIESNYKKSLIDTIGTIDILHFAGMTFLIVALMKKLKWNVWKMLAFALILQGLGTLFIDSFNSSSKPIQYIFGLLFYTNEYISFPTTLWLIYPILGICFAQLLQNVRDKHIFYRKLCLVSIINLFIISIGTKALGYNMTDYFVDHYFQQNIFSTLWIISIVGIAISVCYLISKFLKGKILNGIKYTSTNLNTIYIIQWLLITYFIALREVIGIGYFEKNLAIPIGILIALFSIGITSLWNFVNLNIKKRNEL